MNRHHPLSTEGADDVLSVHEDVDQRVEASGKGEAAVDPGHVTHLVDQLHRGELASALTSSGCR